MERTTLDSVLPHTPAAKANHLQLKLQHSRVEAADLLGVSLRTLDRLVADKQLSVRRIGRRVFITRDALSRFTKTDHQTGGAQ